MQTPTSISKCLTCMQSFPRPSRHSRHPPTLCASTLPRLPHNAPSAKVSVTNPFPTCPIKSRAPSPPRPRSPGNGVFAGPGRIFLDLPLHHRTTRLRTAVRHPHPTHYLVYGTASQYADYSCCLLANSTRAASLLASKWDPLQSWSSRAPTLTTRPLVPQVHKTTCASPCCCSFCGHTHSQSRAMRLSHHHDCAGD